MEENGTRTKSITISVTELHVCVYKKACFTMVIMYLLFLTIMMMLEPDESAIFEIAIFSLSL